MRSQKIPAVAIGQHDVEQNQVVTGHRQMVFRHGKRLGPVDTVTVQSQAGLNGLSQFLIVLDKEKPHFFAFLSNVTG